MPEDIPTAQVELTGLVHELLSVGGAGKESVVGLGVQVWGSRYRIEEADGSLEVHLIGKSSRPEAILNEKALQEDPTYLSELVVLPEQRRAIEEFQRDFPEVRRAFALKAKKLG